MPFFIQGTSANPVFKANVKAIANEKIQQVLSNPEGAIKNVKEIRDTARGILDMFKKAPAKPGTEVKQSVVTVPITRVTDGARANRISYRSKSRSRSASIMPT